jgi:hypothetical protein
MAHHVLLATAARQGQIQTTRRASLPTSRTSRPSVWKLSHDPRGIAALSQLIGSQAKAGD